MRLSAGSCGRPGGVWLLFCRLRFCLGGGTPVFHLVWLVAPFCKTRGQVSVAARDVVTVPAAASYRGVERHSAVCATGPGCAGVHHLPPTAGEWFSERRVPTLLL